MNNEKVIVKNSKGLIALVVILLIMVLGLTSFIVYDKYISNEGKSEITQNNEDNETNDKTKDAKLKNKVIDMYKSTIVNSDNNLVDSSNINKWVVTKIIYHGYNKNDIDEKYYKIVGYYNCKDNSDKCLYREQQTYEKNNDGTIPFDIEVIINNDNLTPNGSVFIPTEDFVSVEKDLQ